MDTNETKQDEAELAAKQDMADEAGDPREMGALYRKALEVTGDPALATSVALTSWLFSRGTK